MVAPSHIAATPLLSAFHDFALITPLPEASLFLFASILFYYSAKGHTLAGMLVFRQPTCPPHVVRIFSRTSIVPLGPQAKYILPPTLTSEPPTARHTWITHRPSP